MEWSRRVTSYAATASLTATQVDDTTFTATAAAAAAAFVKLRKVGQGTQQQQKERNRVVIIIIIVVVVVVVLLICCWISLPPGEEGKGSGDQVKVGCNGDTNLNLGPLTRNTAASCRAACLLRSFFFSLLFSCAVSEICCLIGFANCWW